MLLLVLLLGAAAPQCGGGDIVRFPPAVLLDREESFRDSLSPADRARLDRALPRDVDNGVAACSTHDGAACDAHAYVEAFNATGLMPRFLAGLCPR